MRAVRLRMPALERSSACAHLLCFPAFLSALTAAPAMPQPKEQGLPTTAYYAKDEVREVRCPAPVLPFQALNPKPFKHRKFRIGAALLLQSCQHSTSCRWVHALVRAISRLRSAVMRMSCCAGHVFHGLPPAKVKHSIYKSWLCHQLTSPGRAGPVTGA